MQNVKLQNVVIESSARALAAPALYCRNTYPTIVNEDGTCQLAGAGQFDFTTYFNGFSMRKWKMYTVIENAYLHLELKGCASRVEVTYADPFSSEPELSTCIEPFAVDQSDGWQTLDIDISGIDEEIVGFRITTEGPVTLGRSYYYSMVDETQIQPVELALGSTTFKKEDFIIPNIERLKESILGCDDPIASHFTVHVIDNGRTLDVEALQSDRVHVYPNDNVGGSGGFARAMIEGMRQEPKATHVLLMDDDVAVSPESIKRTYALLSVVNKKYKDAFVSGAMMNFDIPEDRWEDLGHLDKNGYCFPVKPVTRMTLIQDLVTNEEVGPENMVNKYIETELMYAAWWYCCIPMSVIEDKGLPMPFFVRYDDIEYGIRCQPKFITLNGICIWHKSFHMRYNAAVERYQTTRNGLILKAILPECADLAFEDQLRDYMQKELKKFNYTNAELLIEGLDDYLKGPEFIMERGVVERRFIEANKEQEHLKPLAEIQKDLGLGEITRDTVYSDEPRTFSERALDFLSFNGQRMPVLSKSSEDVVVIPADGWGYPAGKIRGANTLLAVDPHNKKGVIRHKDIDSFNKVWRHYKSSLKRYERTREETARRWREAAPVMRSVEFWMDYLGLSDESTTK